MNLISEAFQHSDSDNPHNHSCIHDQIDLLKQIPKDFKFKPQETRNLAASTPMPMRITVDYSLLNSAANGMTPAKMDYLIRITDSVKVFFSNALLVIPRTTPVKKSWAGNCIDIPVPANLVSPGISDSDLHILVTYTNEPGSSFLANAGWCQLDPGPTVGRILYNLGTMTKMNTTPEAFEDDFETALHETTHILGFSGGGMQYWIDPDTGVYYNASVEPKIVEKRTINTVAGVTVLKSKNVLKTARSYYNCPTLDGVPMENQGGTGSFGSHWERDLIANEYMTASAVSGKGAFSVFTAALLLDTGYYADFNYNFVETTQWGKGKGCNFVANTCNDPAKFNEFAYSGDTLTCDSQNTGQAYIDTYDPFSQCGKLQAYSNQICSNPATAVANAVMRQIVGSSSKCFSSTVIQKGYSTTAIHRCHKITCASDYSSIDVTFTEPSEVYRCTTPGAAVNMATTPLSSTVTGVLNCPNDFKVFCTEPKYCKNSCSAHGFCNNQKCYCLPGYVGDDCSIVCADPNVWDGSNCIATCPAGTFMNPDKTCKSTCFSGYYGDSADRKCKVCNFKCSACTGPNNNQCTACVIPFNLLSGRCVEYTACDSSCLTCSGPSDTECLTCSNGKYLNGSNQCKDCTAPCLNCQTNDTTCLDCINLTDYSYDSSAKKCNLICHSSCLTCSVPNNNTKCLTCDVGKYLSSGQCLACSLPCNACETTANTCLSCSPASNYNYNSGTKKCDIKCDPSCLTCNTPNAANDCATCSDGKYLNASKQCVPCVAPCEKCTNSTDCLSCTPAANYNYNSGTKKCDIKCDPSCLTCNTPNAANDCATCIDGKYLNALKQCVNCVAPCEKCINQSTECLSCTPSSDYIYDSTNKKCNLKCHSTCKTCTLPNNISSCLTCNDGFFLNASNQCKPCTAPCEKCVNQPTECLSCTPPADFIYDPILNKCNTKCDSSCLTCNTANNANDCKTCHDSKYLNVSKQCVPCVTPCDKCTNSSDCISCTPIGDYNYNGTTKKCDIKCDPTCLTCNSANNSSDCLTCNDGFYLNGTKQCKPCNLPCDKCQNSATECLSCTPSSDYIYDSTNKKCDFKCHLSCKTCTLPNNISACSSCNDGFFLNPSQECEPCSAPCDKCENQSTECLSCTPPTDFFYDLTLKKCISNCDVSCLTCNSANNANDCKTCHDGKYLNASKQCQLCTLPCEKCVNSSTECLSCTPSADYIYDSTNKKCNIKCDSTCKTCTLPNDINACSSCNDGFYLNASKQCKPCTLPCQKCVNSSTQCLSCTPSADYIYDSTNKICNIKCHSTCKNCTLPNDINACSSCNDGFYLNASKQCQPCTLPCEKCVNSATECLSCSPSNNYIYDSSNKKCDLKCDITCKTCSLPNNQNECLSCNNGSYLNASKQCKPCVPPCQNCINNANECLTCISLDYNYNSTLKVCDPICDSSCLTCSSPKSSNSCLTCPTSSYLNGNQCFPCTSPCQSCSSTSTSCNSCIADYIYDSATKTCKPDCDSTCQTCSAPKNSNACLTCSIGYFLNGTKCEQCTSPCASCNVTATKCLSCIANYNFDSALNKCEPQCDPSCKTCDLPLNAAACLSCNNQFYLDNKQCKNCQQPCLNCDTTSTKCQNCISAGYTYDSVNFKCLNNCHSSCKTCTLPNDINSCLTCFDGFYLSGNNCLPCTSPCYQCQDNHTKCLSCKPGYSYDSSLFECKIICAPNCKTCTIPQNTTQCNSCHDGYYVTSGNECKQCNAPCKNCSSNPNQCLSCIANYTLDLPTNTCKPVCDSSCKTCSQPLDSNSCTSCNSGYTFDGSKNPKCSTVCHSSCLTCSAPNSPSACLACHSDSFWSSSYCLPCKQPCKSCQNNQDECLNCIDASYTYDPFTKKCLSDCDLSCKTCSASKNPNACTSCFVGSYLNGSKCDQCQSPCKECSSSSTTCTSCIPDYKIDPSNTTKCILQCDSNCKTCSSPNNSNSCLSCNPGYFLNGTTCSICLSPCKECSGSSSSCSNCISNYQLDPSTSQCTPICHSSCLTCTLPNNESSCLTCYLNRYFSSGYCKTCTDDTYLKNNKCEQCISNCKQCKDGSSCSLCNSGYEYNNNQCVEKNIKCHYTCQTCLDEEYHSCTTCVENRVLSSTYISGVGQCNCPSKTTDTNLPKCEDSPLQDNLKVAFNTFFISSATTTTIVCKYYFILIILLLRIYFLIILKIFLMQNILDITLIYIFQLSTAIVSSNPLVIFSLIEFSQTMSFFVYLNNKPALGFDNVGENLYFAHLTKIFKIDSLVPSQTQKSRMLAANDKIDNKSNSKIFQNDKYPYFLANAVLILSLTTFIWFLSFLASFIDSDEVNSFQRKIKRAFFISLPIVIFVMTFQEYSLLIFFQFIYMGFEDNYQAACTLVSIIVFIYLIGFLFYIFYKIQIKQVLVNSQINNQNSLSIVKKTNKIVPISIIDMQKKTYTIEQEKFFILCQYVRQNSFLSRNIILIIVLRKMICSIISVYGFSDPLSQISCLLASYALYWLYIVFIRPFRFTKHTIIYSVLETIILTMHILYFSLIYNEGDSEKEKMISLMMIILTIITFAVYFIISFISLIQYIYSWLSKKDTPTNEQSKSSIHISQNIQNPPQKQVNTLQKFTEKGPIKIHNLINNQNKQNPQMQQKYQNKESQGYRNQVIIPQNLNQSISNQQNQQTADKSYNNNNNNNTVSNLDLSLSYYNQNASRIENTIIETNVLQNEESPLKLNKPNTINNKNYLSNRNQNRNIDNLNDSQVHTVYEQNKYKDVFGKEHCVIDSPPKQRQKFDYLVPNNSSLPMQNMTKVDHSYNLKF